VGPRGVDAAIETTGVVSVIEQAYELTQAEGKTILVGVPRIGDKASIYTLPLHFNKVLKGSHGGGTVPHVDIPRYVRLTKCGKLNVAQLLTNSFCYLPANPRLTMRRTNLGGRILAKCR
jgi:S-(hydroxymethyl)glutathione dehydrogenase/alcohol dehydrogenase